MLIILIENGRLKPTTRASPVADGKPVEQNLMAAQT